MALLLASRLGMVRGNRHATKIGCSPALTDGSVYAIIDRVRKFTVPVRAVYDTDVVRAGIRSQKRPEFKCLQFIVGGTVIPICTPALFLEYEDVLRRPETLKATGLHPEDISEFLIGLAAVIDPVAINFDWRPLLIDPDDDLIANCAINGMADVVVSNNVRHLMPIEQRFGIPVLTAGAFVGQMERDVVSHEAKE